MAKLAYKCVLCILITFMLAISASAQNTESVPISGSEKFSLLGSPKNWVMGPVTGLPSMFGWRIERFWQEGTEELPLWLAGADFGIALPSARVGVERRLGVSSCYFGVGGRIQYVPYGFKEEARVYSLSVPISYRFGGRSGNRSTHVSISAEVFSSDFREWQVLPALQISFLSKM